jgi:hypothetical protein
MSERIEKRGRDAHGNEIVEGAWAVHPQGYIVFVPAFAPLKAGFRWATAEEVESGKAGDAPPAAEAESSAPMPIEGRYLVHPDGHVFLSPKFAPSQLKDGFRVATAAEIASGRAAQDEPEEPVSPTETGDEQQTAPPAASGEQSVDGS